jgi:glyoxylase-like metal-dependent hydrolase (beta-lactamase superfamily II)
LPVDMSAEELVGLLGLPGGPVVLDVREPDEVAAWPMPGALNIPLGELAGRLSQVPSARLVVTLCASGNRSRTAAHVLEEAGYKVANLMGGMAAWAQAYDTAELQLPRCLLVQVRRRGKGCLSYVLGAGEECYVVDPSLDCDLYQKLAAERGWRISRVFDTHLHADHLSGARELAQLARASLHLNPADQFAFDFDPLADGASFGLPGGAELSVAVLHTPGHTEGSTMFFVEGKAVLSGDTVFVDGVGRPDLAERAEAFARNLHRSLRSKVLPLPDDVVVLPAHYGEDVEVVPGEVVGAKLGELRRSVGPLSLDEEAFVAWATARIAERPANYQAIVELNRGARAPTSGAPRELEVGPNRCSA